MGLVNLGLLLALWLTAPPRRVDPAGYAGLRVGMSRAEVEAHLGVQWPHYARNASPGLRLLEGAVDPKSGPLATPLATWLGDDYAICLRFDGAGRVREKALCSVVWRDADVVSYVRRRLCLL
jgi:hypothetical protein